MSWANLESWTEAISWILLSPGRGVVLVEDCVILWTVRTVADEDELSCTILEQSNPLIKVCQRENALLTNNINKEQLGQ